MEFTYIQNGASLAIDENRCIGCGDCIEVCPHAVLLIREGKAVIENRSFCMECGACQINCPVDAIIVKSGVGCAAAIINGILNNSEPNCGCSGKKGGCC